jgi:hypothetical protein
MKHGIVLALVVVLGRVAFAGNTTVITQKGSTLTIQQATVAPGVLIGSYVVAIPVGTSDMAFFEGGGPKQGQEIPIAAGGNCVRVPTLVAGRLASTCSAP